MDSGSLPTSSERRVAKYKEERRRQLASQIAFRLSSNRSSSSSSDNDDDNFRISGGESTGSGNGSAYSKYRRHRSKRLTEKEAPSIIDKTSVKHVRRRRRRSLASATSPLTAVKVDRTHEKHKLKFVKIDQEGNKSPKKLNQFDACEDVRPEDAHQSQSNRARTANVTPQSDPSDRPTHLNRDLEGEKLSFGVDKVNFPSNDDPDLVFKAKEQFKKSLLNTSYSSEEQLYQTATSLQSLGDQFYSSTRRHRSSGQSLAPSFTTSLSSPEMIKSLTRTLTPPVSPFHANRANVERKSPSVVQLKESDILHASASKSSALISDPLDHLNWPGRPKRNSVGIVSESQKSKGPSLVLVTRPRSSSRGSSETDLSLNIFPSADSGTGLGTGSSSTPTTSGKPPIFPLSEKTLLFPSKPATDLSRRHILNAAYSTFNPNEPAPPHPSPNKRTKSSNALASRPHSAFIPRFNNTVSLKCASFEIDKDDVNQEARAEVSRRKSDFLSRYECLMNRAQALMQAMDGLEIDESRKKDVSDSDAEIEFNEEEVLQLCKEFLRGFDGKSKVQASLSLLNRKTLQLPGTSAFDNEESSKPSLRTRSSSLTIHDKRSIEDQIQLNLGVTCQRSSITSQAVYPKPILKKSSEDLKPTPILKNRCDSDLPITGSSSASSAGSVSGGILKRKSVTDSGNETAASRPDHIRIRSPSPDPYASDDEHSDRPLSRRSILRSRRVSSSVDERASSPDYLQSILKRRSSQEDLEDCSAGTSGATSRSSPEPPHSILKRKLSVGSIGSHSPEGSFGSASSILRKKCHSQHSSCQGSLEDLSCEGEKIRSILKKRSTVSTDDELLNMVDSLHDRPKSILKGRRSEESLSPLSDPSELDKSQRLYKDEISIKPILKQKDSRDCFSPVNETMEKSNSPTRGASAVTQEAGEIVFCGSSSSRRSSLPISPRRLICEQEVSQGESESNGSSRTSFITKAVVYIDGNFLKSPQGFLLEDEQNGALPSEDGPLPCVSNQRQHVQTYSWTRGLSKEDHQELEDEIEAAGRGEQKRAILRHDSLELVSEVTRLKGVLKKDSSYEKTQRPILKNTGEDDEVPIRDSCFSSNTTSSEDLDIIFGGNRAFSGVVIDPVPGCRRSAGTTESELVIQNESNEDLEALIQKSPIKSRKSSLVHPRQPVIPPSSVKITSDANLAMQLDCLADRAEAELEKRRNQQDSKGDFCQGSQISDESTTNSKSQQSASASSERKPSNDLSAEEYYNIYLNSKKSVRNKKLQFERGGSFKTEKVTSENTVQVDIPQSRSFKIDRSVTQSFEEIGMKKTMTEMNSSYEFIESSVSSEKIVDFTDQGILKIPNIAQFSANQGLLDSPELCTKIEADSAVAQDKNQVLKGSCSSSKDYDFDLVLPNDEAPNPKLEHIEDQKIQSKRSNLEQT